MFEKTFDPKSIEEKHYKAWEGAGSFASHPDGNATPWAVMMPPPNVTGSLHMGHALNSTLQDVLTRYYRMKGRDALWQPGTDHAGIATQMVVERMLDKEGLNRHKMGRDKFLDRVWKWKAESGGTIVGQLKRLGTTPDWARERFTMDEGMSRAVLKAFVQLYKDGMIYKDKRLVNWDPKLLTAISDLEVEHKEQKGKMYHFRYPYEDGSGYVVIATTRPETILADGAVAVHPDDERYKDLVGKFVVVPVINRIIPVVADEHVDPEFGSGAVKVTAAHDFNDFEVYLRHKDKGIPLINLFTPDAKMNENCPEDYQGLDRFEARKKVIADFEELEYLEKIEDHVNKVPYGDRSGVVIEPMLTDQWYVDTPTLAKPAIEAVRSGQTVFVPKTWENMYFDWLENQQPWCISRQLWWGHQIPAWYGPDGKFFVAETEAEAQAQADKHYEEKVKITRDEDVLDTWFSSALWPFSTLGWPDKTKELDRYYPGDVLVTGFDIITFWVSRMMMMGLHFMKEVPFKTVYIHALVRDAKGQKMSKSKGNVMDPLDLIDKFGADALRFTLTAMAAQGRDIKLSEDRVEGYRNFCTKLWNASRYCSMNECKLDPKFDPASATFTPNQWIISSLYEMNRAVEEALANYKFNDAANAVYQFVWGTFCDWYLEFTKPAFAAGGSVKEEIQKTTAWVLDQVLTIMNPFMPFITEELYGVMAERKDGKRLIESSWPEYSKTLSKPDAMEEISWLSRLISEIRSVRVDMNVPAAAKIQLLMKQANPKTQERLKKYDEIIKRMARLETIGLTDEAPKGSLQTVLDEATIVLPIASIIDLDKERARLRKEIDRIQQEIKKVDQKLGNEQFVQNAPAEILEEHRNRKTDFTGTLDKLSTALKQLEAA